MRTERLCLAAAACAALGASGLDAATQWPLRLEEAANVSRTQWPVTGGLPFAQGVLKDVSALRLADAAGKPAEMQARPLARWPDGSVKWALLDFQADLKPGETARWNLTATEPAGKGASAELGRQTPDGVVVITGPLKFLVPASGPALFRLWLDAGDAAFNGPDLAGETGPADAFIRLQATPPGAPDRENWLRDAANDPGTLFRASHDAGRKATLEENGPVRATVRIDGWHVSDQGRRVFPYTLRVHLFKGSSRIRFQHTLIPSENVKENFLREMGVVLPFPGKQVRAVVGLPGGACEKALAPGDDLSVSAIGDPRIYHFISFREKKRVRFAAEHREGDAWKKLAEGEDPPGWAALSHDRGGLALGFRYFRNMHPKEIRIGGDGRASVYLWPERGNKCLDLRRRSETLDNGYLENDRDAFDGRGSAVTHEWMAEYSSKPISAAVARDLALAVNEPVFPYVSPEYYAATRAFGDFLPYDPQAFPRLEASIAFSFRYCRALRKAYGMDGMIDWGDIAIMGVGSPTHKNEKDPTGEGLPYRGYYGWCNADFGILHGFFLHYVRTGDRKVLLDGEAMAQHVMDVDTRHYCPEAPATIGMGHRHDQQHWGNGVRDYCFAPNGSIDLYLLTGNRRAFDVAHETADFISAGGSENARYQPLRFWEISGEEKYLRAAQDILCKDLAGRKDGWPFTATRGGFRTSTYSGAGLVFYDSIRPNAELRAAFLKVMAFEKDNYLTTIWKSGPWPEDCLYALGYQHAPSPQNAAILRGAVSRYNYAGLTVDPKVLDVRDSDPFDKWLSVNRATLNISRTDVFGMLYWVGLPRVLSGLKAAGITEAQCADRSWMWVDPPSYEETLDPKKITKGAGQTWVYAPAHQSPPWRVMDSLPKEIQGKWNAAYGRHQFMEDGLPLGPNNAWWYGGDIIARDGRFGWRRDETQIIFATPDNSDPRTNGRAYKLVYTNEADAKWRDVPAFEETLSPADFVRLESGWMYRPKHPLPARPSVYPERAAEMQQWRACLARMTLRENDRPLEALPAFGDPRAISKVWKKGAWQIWDGVLLFTTPDNSAPPENGRAYKFVYTAEAAR